MPRLTGLSANLSAFLDMLAVSEIGPALLAVTDGYNVLVGATPDNPLTFPSYAAHPDILNKALDSTAAGRYQFIHRTWVALQTQLGLPDFSPESQDKGAIELFRQVGALPHIEAGEFARAVALCAPVWASLPGSTAGQHPNTLSALETAYTSAGGALA